ncbi:MAG TPA: NAD(P)-binding protein [Acidimicrobiales bacterium]|nr:NAD(P)-binding protein [Acidimicrobiales bacterium]
MDKPFAVTLDVGSSLANKTGAWRVERPVYVDRLPPCNDACPAGENIQGWLYRAEEGDYEGAWLTLVEDNPMPAVMGRVCFHPCETACNRGQVDEAVGINAVERFLGDMANERGWRVPPDAIAPSSRRSVLVVGSGPAGLSAAYHLCRLGHAVTIRESSPLPGGMLRYGIPRYRLPRDVVSADIDRILAMGVTLQLDRCVDNVPSAMATEGFDAVFLGVGAQIGRNAYIPAGDSAHVLDAVSLLRSMEAEAPPMLGRRVVVVGGGDTAMDAARTARRLGAEDPIVVYRRTRERMPADDTEVEEAIEEGVSMRWLSTVARAEKGNIVIERMELDAEGFPRPTGEFEDLEADALVLAMGQESDLSLVSVLADVEIADGVVQVRADRMTGHPGVFAGGDMTTGERTVTSAVGDGKAAARAIDRWLRSEPPVPVVRHGLATAERLNTWYYADAPKTLRPRLELSRRTSTFDEVVAGLDESTALFEARRCMSCGNCFECDNCFGVCPDNAVHKLGLGQRYQFDYDYCKGCGLCAMECPCGAIDMVPERI